MITKIYLQKTNYKIDSQNIELQDTAQEPPLNFFRSIRQFENGQVYEVLLKNNEGEFISYD